MLKFKNRVSIIHKGKKVIEALGQIHVIAEDKTYTKTYNNKEDFQANMEILADKQIIKNSYCMNISDGILFID